jgi:hypothetical protein
MCTDNVAVIVDTSQMKFPSDSRKDGAGVYLYTGTKTTQAKIRGALFRIKIAYAKLKAFPNFVRTEY